LNPQKTKPKRIAVHCITHCEDGLSSPQSTANQIAKPKQKQKQECFKEERTTATTLALPPWASARGVALNARRPDVSTSFTISLLLAPNRSI
jgi:hypothetical protein